MRCLKVNKYLYFETEGVNRIRRSEGPTDVDLGMGHPTRTTRPNPPEKNPTRPDPSYVAGGRGPYFLTRNNQRAGHGP